MYTFPFIAQRLQSSVIRLFHNKTSPSFLTDSVNRRMADTGEIKVGNFLVNAWTLAGVESTIVVKSNFEGNKFKIAFDMGYATKSSVTCEHVFISHGHMDHIAGIVHHAMKRNLQGMKPAKYYVAEHLVEPLRQIVKGHCELQLLQRDRAFIDEMSIKKMDPGESVSISRSCRVVAFPTTHRVISQGYIVYVTKRTRKPEYSTYSNEDMRKLIADGVEINDIIETPQIAYTGDTTSDIFTNVPVPDLLKVKLLIVESTYIDSDVKQDQSAIDRARQRGHIHLQELVNNSKAFDSVDHIVLVHFSEKYSIDYLRRTVKNMLKDDPKLYEKLHLGTLMKEKY